MIIIKNTPNNAGISICGDRMDFEGLYDALHTIVGDEDEHVEYGAARIRVLGVCYDIRHAMMGDREYEFVDNGMDADIKRNLSVLAPDHNIYLKINVLWPEMLFVAMALNEFVELYARKKAKSKYSLDLLAEPKVIWDTSIAQVRMFQSALADCIRPMVTENVFSRILNSLNGRYIYVARYVAQYIDILNERFLNMSSDKRIKSISVFAKRIAEHDDEYHHLEADLRNEAKKQNCSVDDLVLAIDYPEEIEW